MTQIFCVVALDICSKFSNQPRHKSVKTCHKRSGSQKGLIKYLLVGLSFPQRVILDFPMFMFCMLVDKSPY